MSQSFFLFLFIGVSNAAWDVGYVPGEIGITPEHGECRPSSGLVRE